MDIFDQLDYIFGNKKKSDPKDKSKKKSKDDDDWDICPYCGEYIDECTCDDCECDDFR